ncbi:MAG: reverse transcriptase family protein, partial [Candidatus Thiodiazotropha sp.]
MISKHDLVFLNETWISSTENINLELNGYCSEHISGNKSKNTKKGRFSGGISFYYKTELRKHIQIIEKNQFGIIWVKISSELFSFQEDIYLCHIYIPPNNSKVFCTSEIDLFEQLELDIVKYNNVGKVFISGDFNSRTSDSHDYFDFDKYLDETLYNLNTCSRPNRTNKDCVIDYHGLRLLELCQATGLLIVNGRLFNDMNQGKFTFCSQAGQSTVDYLLTDLSNFDILSFFDVLDFNEFSDHSPISFCICTKYKSNQTNTIETNNITRKIVWDKTKISEFRTRIMNTHQAFFEQNADAQNESVDHVVQNLTRYLHDNAFDIFGKTSYNKNYTTQNKKVRNEWFDENCVNAQRDFKSARNIFNRSKNEESRINFTRARTRFNRIKRKAKQRYKIKEGQRINKMAKSQPKKFWQNIKSTFKKKQERAETLTLDDLHEYFKSMFDENMDNNTTDRESNEAEIDLDIDPSISNDQLDADFTEEELRRAIFTQKDNKASGIDCISTEILKASFDFISPFLLSLYNRLFASGEYPRSWGEGIITPIFKKGNVNDAANYRGITLINVLAKVYSQLLLNRLTKWTEMYDKITKSQFGFQKRKSIIDCIFILQSVVSKVLSKGQKLYCVFIDYEKCFDKIDRTFLWQ